MQLVWIITGLLFAAAGATDAAAPFAVGEKLSYRALWGFIPVGEASLEVRNIETVAGRPCYRLVAEAHTTGAGRLLYRFDSVVESWLDVATAATYRHRNQTTEGKTSYTEETVFDYAAQTAITSNLTAGTVQSCRLDGPALDVISALYTARTRPMRPGLPQSLLIHASATNYVVSFKPEGPTTLDVRPVGAVPAVRIEPLPTLKFVARHRGRLWFWISNDERRLPLLAVTNTKLGTARLVLTRIETSPPAPPRKLAAAIP